MKGHPGGSEHTLRMLSLAGIRSGRVLDMGAGAGESVELMRAQGISALGVDLEPRGENVLKGDMLRLPFADEEFDGVLSQCSFFVGGDIPGALSEAYRVLKKGGRLMLSDVCFEEAAPLIRQTGFVILYEEDMTPLWREYYFEALWNGSADCCEYRGSCRYMLYICGKE
ncbi:MAG: class I SAM-dependent methyltransferase [Oscillospiraceae bacterium]|nr:class I SAM-dependent methyltransferase [Oscillospiraceae bacterium]